ncbi:MAG: carboxypeptidase regulatory-like domain-containing protein [Planctomycetota bacterium]|nr:MAG: carboxypeptidase regulatory-like domain-containing protein [Planctomycetota bacterium]
MTLHRHWIFVLCTAAAALACRDLFQEQESQKKQARLGSNKLQVLPFNDLGMHCMDKEFSVFSILPPFNVVNAQAVFRNPLGDPVVLDDTHVELRYMAVTDPQGSRNSVSHPKTDFWTYADDLFGVSLQPGESLTGLYMPKEAPLPGPQDMHYDSGQAWFSAEGIPITPLDDAGHYNPYPLMRIGAFHKGSGRLIAFTDVVVPVSQETDCQNCHATGQMAANRPGISWSSNADIEVQTKENILILHDVEENTQLMASMPVLCADCHYSPPLDLAGTGPNGNQIGNPTMSATMHLFHGQLTDGQGNPVFPPDGTVEETCYQCHPGVQTQCQRGAMKTGGMLCADCHGDMLAVGGAHPLLPGGSLDGQNDGQPRRPWIDLPRCQSCHTGDAVNHMVGSDLIFAPDGIRLMQAFRNNDPSASPILANHKRFAENNNTLYRFSRGHGGVACEACHGSTHAEWPNADPTHNDNVTAWELQGHTGLLMECNVCHVDGTLPPTMNGPHGMHNVGDPAFVDHEHEEFWEHNKTSCKACHGLNYEGTPLSKMAKTRTFVIEHGRRITLTKGTQVRCDHCHSMPN